MIYSNYVLLSFSDISLLDIIPLPLSRQGRCYKIKSSLSWMYCTISQFYLIYYNLFTRVQGLYPPAADLPQYNTYLALPPDRSVCSDRTSFWMMDTLIIRSQKSFVQGPSTLPLLSWSKTNEASILSNGPASFPSYWKSTLLLSGTSVLVPFSGGFLWL